MQTFSYSILLAFILGIIAVFLTIIPSVCLLDADRMLGFVEEKDSKETSLSASYSTFVPSAINGEAVSKEDPAMNASVRFQQGVHVSIASAKATPLEYAFAQLSLDESHNESLKNHSFATDSAFRISLSTPVLWHVPKSGGTSLKAFIACLDIAVACQAGKFVYDADGAPLEENFLPSLEMLHRKNFGYYINVDVSSKDGIQAAHNVGFHHWLPSVHSRMAIVTSLLQTAAKLLFPVNETLRISSDNNATGALLAVLRDPIDRQVSLFHYLQRAKHESTYHPEWQNLTIAEWSGGEDNWMVRVLSGVLESDAPNRALDRNDLQKAKDILSRYALIGFTDHMAETIDQFGFYLGWNRLENWDQCRAKYRQTKQNNASESYVAVKKYSKDWYHIAKKNQLDMELFEHAKAVFEKQKQ